ncbi:MAG TPA: DinB family protein [Gemmataceae bacterium]|nr:DinB family protein [Gemmataceae bacterium]
MSRLQDALDRITLIRSYTRGLIDTIDPADWFRMPAEGITHVAWQVGHLAFAEYGLCLMRLRGPRPDDQQIITPGFIAAFRRESVPEPDPAKFPPVAEIRATFDRVHERVLSELPAFPDAELDTLISPPHRICKTRFDCVRWCPYHEMTHAGQIGLLRRLFGQKPMW